jgi:uncharacterized protein (DUF4415 family)
MKTTKTNLDKLDSMVDNDIDYSDSPEVTEEFFKIAFMRKSAHKKAISLRLDEDLIEFFKTHSDKYQSKINDVLRAYKLAYEMSHQH